MRSMKRLSPTALHCWERDREEFYTKYLSERRAPRMPQSHAMSVGSSFDAYVKACLHASYYGPVEAYSFDTLFNEQCEKHTHPFARAAGDWCWDRYQCSGAADEIYDEIYKGDKKPRFEFTLKERVNGIPLQGKPDLEFKVGGMTFIYDWKVNGYCGKRPTSPRPLYRYCRDTWNLPDEDWEGLKNTRGGDKAHPKYKPTEVNGIEIGQHWMEDVSKVWADQLSIYAWMLGLPIGSEDWVAGIDQLACKPWQKDKPLIRVAQHRCRVSSFWQHSLFGRIQSCWSTLQSGHIFTDVSRSESDAKCEILDMQIYDDDEFWGLLAQKGYMG